MNCTISGNYAVNSGGGAETATLDNCIVYHNSALMKPEYEGGWVQPPDAENRMSGGVGGWRGAIPVTRPDRGRPPHIAAQNAGYLSQADAPMMKVGAAWWGGGQSWRGRARAQAPRGASALQGHRRRPRPPPPGPAPNEPTPKRSNSCAKLACYRRSSLDPRARYGSPDASPLVERS